MSFLVHLLILFLSLNLSVVYADDDQFVYSGFAGANLTLDGMATVTPDCLLELTNGTAYLKGHAFYPTPLRFRESSHNGTVRSFSTSFVFTMLPVYPEQEIVGHGIAFVVAPSNNLSAATANQYLGLLNSQNNGNVSNHIFAIELDSVLNFELQDINDNHVGININSLRSLESYTAGYFDDNSGVFQNLTLTSHEAMQVWVDYEGEATRINVTMAPLKLAKPVRPLMSITYDLAAVVTDQGYVGFSSATSTLISRNYVLGWSFSMNGPTPAIDASKLPKLPRVGPKPRSRVVEIILPITSAIFVLTAVATVLLRRRHMRYAELREDWEVEFGPQRFSYKDLYHATEGFEDKHLLGSGGFGRVYKGVLPTCNLEVAVKMVSHESRQGMREFIAEVVSMGRLRHRNIVQLLGYCRRKGELLLVYDYMPNGSLDKYLYSHGERATLGWSRRLRIIKGVASGLLYMHEDWDQVVIHRDIKASNVLLDREMNGRLGDFGLARLYDHGTNPQTTHMVGTIGYLAPELTRTGKATPLTDVFAFGVFLLEVTCGQRPIEQKSEDNRVILIELVLEHWHKGSLTKVVDARLQNNYDTAEACLVLKLGLLCSHPSPTARPSMRHVMQYLDGDLPLPELTPMDTVRNKEFDMHFVPLPSSLASIGTMSSLSGGR